MPDQPIQLPPVPEAKRIAKNRTRFSPVWLVPIVAALAGAWIAVTRILDTGPTITIVFHTAEGLEAGKTKIHYNGVDVGTITAIRLSDDHHRVIATAQMAPHTEDFLVEDTQFWVVKPRISGANISGLGTLISGSYIGMEIGQSSTKKKASSSPSRRSPIIDRRQSRAASSSSRRRSWARSTAARRSTSGASRSARSRRTRSIPTARR